MNTASALQCLNKAHNALFGLTGVKKFHQPCFVYDNVCHLFVCNHQCQLVNIGVYEYLWMDS